MAFDQREWADVMTDSATVFAATNRDAYGTQSTVTVGATYLGHVSFTPTRMLTDQGEEVVSHAQFIVAGVVTNASFGDRVVLSDGRSYKVIGIRTYHDEDGPHHTTLALQ